MRSDSYLFSEAHIPAKAAFPVIDAHNHLWANWDSIESVVKIMDEVGVVTYCDLTANVSVAWVDGGYTLEPPSIQNFFENCVNRYPGRFYGFTTATFCKQRDQPLFASAGEFVEETIDVFRRDVKLGARGLKILKEFGMYYRDSAGSLIAVDDLRLAPIWEEAGKLGVPVLIHQSDPYGFFQKRGPENEHEDTLNKFPTWAYSGPNLPSKAELLERRDNLVRRHPQVTFLLPHVANFPEDLGGVGRLLDENPNVYIDFSARIDELGRQPYTAREFLIHYQDRVYFGTDMPASVDMYRCHFRFLETRDEFFISPDYDGTFGRHRWRIYGLGLPAEVLAKIYYQNALKIVPALNDIIKGKAK